MPRPNDKPRDRYLLYRQGKYRARRFCEVNGIHPPDLREPTPIENWGIGYCAYYRPAYIEICLETCGRCAGETVSRNWSWPGSDTDREPFGVICHELGHHVDWLSGTSRGRYFSDYGEAVMNDSGERPVSGYCPNPAEWFAEMFRLFVTNAALLAALRPRTFAALRERWEPISKPDWIEELGTNVPDRIVANLEKKVKRSR